MTPVNISLTRLGLLQLFAGIGALFAASHSATGAIIFDDSQTAGFATHQVPGNTNGADNGPGGTISVAQNTTITGFSLYTFSTGGSDLKFFIYDETTSSFSYLSAPVTFAPDTFDTSNNANFTYKQSPTFSLVLHPSDTYDLGATSDTDTYYAYGYANDGNGTATHTENGITGPIRNILVENYANPTVKPSGTGSVADPGSAQIALQIFDGSVSTPEPASLGLLAIGAFGTMVRRRSRSS